MTENWSGFIIMIGMVRGQTGCLVTILVFISMHDAWQVYTSRGRWTGDTRLRVECFDQDIADKCCKVVLVRNQEPSLSSTSSVVSDRIGVYVSDGYNSQRLVYKHVDLDR